MKCEAFVARTAYRDFGRCEKQAKHRVLTAFGVRRLCTHHFNQGAKVKYEHS